MFPVSPSQRQRGLRERGKLLPDSRQPAVLPEEGLRRKLEKSPLDLVLDCQGPLTVPVDLSGEKVLAEGSLDPWVVPVHTQGGQELDSKYSPGACVW
eukprot:bmy_08509T0